MTKNLGRGMFMAGALACLLAGSAASTAFAQSEKPELLRIAIIKVKSGAATDAEEALKLAAAAYKKAGTPAFHVWQTAVFGPTRVYVAVRPVKNYAEFDSVNVVEQQLSKQEFARFSSLADSSTESIRYLLVQTIPSASIDSKRKTPPAFARVMIVQTKAGKALEFEEWLQNTIVPAMKKNDIKDYWVDRTVLGGNVGEYTILTPFDRWAEMDSWPTPEKLMGGPAGFKQYMAKVAELASSAETEVAKYRTDLSYMTAQ